MGKRKKQRDDESRESSPSEPEEGGKAPSPKRLRTEGDAGGEYGLQLWLSGGFQTY